MWHVTLVLNFFNFFDSLRYTVPSKGKINNQYGRDTYVTVTNCHDLKSFDNSNSSLIIMPSLFQASFFLTFIIYIRRMNEGWTEDERRMNGGALENHTSKLLKNEQILPILNTSFN